MNVDELRAALQKDLRETCEKATNQLEALRPLHDNYLRALDALTIITRDRGELPGRCPFDVWLIEVINGLGGYRIR